MGLSGPVIEFPIGTFHKNSGSGSLLKQADPLHTIFHESFHFYQFRAAGSILRDFGSAAGWFILPDWIVRRMANCDFSTCDPEVYGRILIGTSSQDSDQILSDYGESGLHEDFAETSAQFAEIWLSQNGFPIAKTMHDQYSSRYTSDPSRNLLDADALESTVDWLEDHYGRNIQTTYPR